MEIFIGSLDFLKKLLKLFFDIFSTSMFKWKICVKNSEQNTKTWTILTWPVQYMVPIENYDFWLWENFTNANNVIGSTEILSPNYELTHLTNSSRTSKAGFGK